MSTTAVRGIVKGDRKRFAHEKRQQLLNLLGVSIADWNTVPK
jgi:hypothetical protein